MAMELSVVRTLRMREMGYSKFDLQHILLTKMCLLNTLGPQMLDIVRRYPAYACKASLRDENNFFALAYEDGSVAFQAVEESVQPSAPATVRAHSNAIFDVCWIPGEELLLTASGDESTVLINISGSRPKIQDTFQGHTASVRRVTACPGSPFVFATGGRDGTIILWDTRTHVPQDRIWGAHRAAGPARARRSHSVLDLKYMDGQHLMSCGNADNAIKVWDVRRTHTINQKKPVHSFFMKNPTPCKAFLDITLDPDGSHFYVSSTCNKIYRYKFYEKDCEVWFEGAYLRNDFIRTCMSPDGEYLASGSLDNNAYIWPARRNDKGSVLPMAKLVGHNHPVTAIAWTSFRATPLVITCSDDNQEMVWGVPYLDPSCSMTSAIEGQVEMLYPEIPKGSKGSKGSKRALKLNASEASTSKALEHTPTKAGPAEESFVPLTALTPDQCTPSGSRRPPNDCNGNRSGQNPVRFLENLPNLVVNGKSPYNLESPVQANRKENFDWLTQHRLVSASEEKARNRRSSGKKRPGICDSLKKRKD